MKAHAAAMAMVGLIAGCNVTTAPGNLGNTGSSGVDPAVQEDPAASDKANLAKLQALQIFEVYGVIAHIPQSANCYSTPCPGHEAEFAAAQAEDAQHVADLTAIVLAAAAEPPSTDPAVAGATDANLEKLRMLGVVEIGNMIVAEPKNNPNCYNLPCPEDKAAADAVNHEREGRLANIAKAF